MKSKEPMSSTSALQFVFGTWWLESYSWLLTYGNPGVTFDLTVVSYGPE